MFIKTFKKNQLFIVTLLEIKFVIIISIEFENNFPLIGRKKKYRLKPLL